MRINKFLSQAGVCSRREADRLTEQGQILVNGLAATPGTQIGEADVVEVLGRTLRLSDLDRGRTRILMLYKPAGVVTSTVSTHGEETVIDFLKKTGIPGNTPEERTERFYPVGRLDKDSEGLLLLTNRGDWVNDALRSRNEHEKEYEVRIDGRVTPAFLSAMEAGVYLPELEVTTRGCCCTKTGEDSFRIVISQGYNRQIRRMSDACGAKVVKLKRIRFMNLTLGALKSGEVRELTETEISELMKELGRTNQTEETKQEGAEHGSK